MEALINELKNEEAMYMDCLALMPQDSDLTQSLYIEMMATISQRKQLELKTAKN